MFATGYTDLSGLAGISMVNMPIFSSLTATVSTALSSTISAGIVTTSATTTITGYTDSLFTGSTAVNSWARFDNCLAFVDAAGGNIGIKTLSPCSFWGKPIYTNTVPGMNKVKSPVSFFLGELYKSTFIYRSNYGGMIGIAKDGHVIYGPYNKDGELWGCTDTDYCNGFFLGD